MRTIICGKTTVDKRDAHALAEQYLLLPCGGRLFPWCRWMRVDPL
jgi:hypothetical protein